MKTSAPWESELVCERLLKKSCGKEDLRSQACSGLVEMEEEELESSLLK